MRSDTEFYTDSKVVLGFIYNETRRPYVYVHNRVLRIRRSTCPKQWHFVPTDHNPADQATRSVAANRLKDTIWFTGPAFLYNSEHGTTDSDTFTLVDADTDAEIRPQVSTLHRVTSDSHLKSHRFSWFLTWKPLVRAITCLVHVARSFFRPVSMTVKAGTVVRMSTQ